MSSIKIAITVEDSLLKTYDDWVRAGKYPSRSQAIQAAMRKLRLTEALKLVDRAEEQALSEEWYEGEEWPEY